MRDTLSPSGAPAEVTLSKRVSRSRWCFAQTCLVAGHRTDLHRRLGVVAVLTEGLLVLVSRS